MIELNKAISNQLLGFFLKASCLYTIWQISYDFFILPDGRVDDFLALTVISGAKYLLSILGWEIYSYIGALYNIFVCASVGVVVSLLTKPPSKDKVDGLTVYDVSKLKASFKGGEVNDLFDMFITRDK